MLRKIEIDIWGGCPADDDERAELFNREFARILPLIAEGYCEGQVFGEQPAYEGWWRTREEESPTQS